MAKSKKDKKVVVNQAYFELIERKAQALDDLCCDDGAISVSAQSIKTIGKIAADWDKVDAGDLSGFEAYTEPAE